MQVVVMARPTRAGIHSWGEPKTRRVQLLMTPTAVDVLDTVADDLGLTRGEVNERLIRGDVQIQQAASRTLAAIQAAKAQAEK